MSRVYVFPGQGSQFTGMAKGLYKQYGQAKELIDSSNDILGFDIRKIMFEGTEEELKQTKVTQPAIFIHSVVAVLTSSDFDPEMVAGHSLGEFSALVANGVLSFECGLELVSKRALAMQAACEQIPSTMAAVIGLEDEVAEKVCEETDGVVVAANYNCPGQLVISGEVKAVHRACDVMKEIGAKRVLILPVGGAFHSPLMESARVELSVAINTVDFAKPKCPIYQNIDAKACSNVESIKENLIAQLTSPVRWTQSVQNMLKNGASEFIECGPGKVLQGLIKKVDRRAVVRGIS